MDVVQTPLSCLTPSKYTFSFKGVKHVPIAGVNNKRQIIATFAVSATEEFLLMQLIHARKLHDGR